MSAHKYNILLNRLKQADTEAFNELYIGTRERLFVYALTIVKDEIIARDIVQDIFIDFWDKQIFQNIQTGIISYLLTTVRNRSIDHLKKNNTHKKLKKEFDYFFEEDYYISKKYDNEELEIILKNAIKQLPLMPGKVFLLHYLEKKSHQEIADMLGISKHTVSNHMDRALKQLRGILKK